MTDTVVADFTTDVIPDTVSYDEPVRGRILMNREKVVMVTADDRTAFAIDDIFDVAYGTAPKELRQFFEDTVTIAYESMGARRVAIIEGEDDVVGRFTNLIFKGVLNDTPVSVTHPAKVGGRITDTPVRPASLFVDPKTVKFTGEDSFTIDISTVSYFERVSRELDGASRPVLSVRHAPNTNIVTTEIALAPEKKMNVLGRFLRIEYSQLREDLADITLNDEEIEVIVGLYSGATEGSLAGMLGVETSRVTLLLNKLVEKGLVEETPGGMELTAIGNLAVGEHIEDVNL